MYDTSGQPLRRTSLLFFPLDISPATAQYLSIDDSDTTEWRFVDEKDVPDGPWKAIITRS